MRSLARWGLVFIPAAMIVFGAPLLNRLEPRVAGLPFIFAWLMFWVLVTPLFLVASDRVRGQT
jgi:Protein of unknown function (DUF3311)